jgi:hypothetical protein
MNRKSIKHTLECSTIIKQLKSKNKEIEKYDYFLNKDSDKKLVSNIYVYKHLENDQKI